jgi:hypothetical protein
MFKHFTLMFLAAVFMVAAAVVFMFPSIGHAADGTVAVPIGDWITQSVAVVSTACVTVLTAIIARWAPAWVRTYLTEQLLSRAVDYALGVVAGAAKGKVLEVPIANAVLREAATYAVEHAPTTAKWIGDTLTPKLIARLSAAGSLPETAYYDPGLHPTNLLTAPAT